MNIETYYQRIGFVPNPGESPEEQLYRIHECHSYTIPFEDLNPLCHVPVSTNPEDVFRKVILRRRGGYCFELNMLFQELLKELGYQTRAIFCRPYSAEGVKLALSHRFTIVTIGQQEYLADVGLGGNGWVAPLRLEVGTEQLVGTRVFKITGPVDGEYTVNLKFGDTFAPVLDFTKKEAVPFDFEMSNYYTSSYARSPFVNRMMCVLPTRDGRYTIRDRSLTLEKGTVKEVIPLTPENIEKILDDYFGICLTTAMLQQIKEYLS